MGICTMFTNDDQTSNEMKNFERAHLYMQDYPGQDLNDAVKLFKDKLNVSTNKTSFRCKQNVK